MALSLWQKIRLGLRGWMRRREENASRREREFVESSTTWTPAVSAPVHSEKAGQSGVADVDLEGLQVAFLDDSGRLIYFLDLETGEVVEQRVPNEAPLDLERYLQVPRRSVSSDAEDRRLFVERLDDSPVRRALEETIGAADEAFAFRKAIALERAAERAFYSFKNDRASQAIAEWLASL